MTEPLLPAPSAGPTSGQNGTTRGLDGKALANTSAGDVGGTSTQKLRFARLKKADQARRAPRRKPLHETQAPSIKRDVAILKASGMTTNSVAKTLKRDPVTILRVQKLPEVQQMIAELRQAWKQESQSKVTELAGETWNMVGEFVNARDSKQLDYTMRAVHAMEKVSASVSGEGQKVEVTGSLMTPPQMELKVLVGRLFGDGRVLDSPRG